MVKPTQELMNEHESILQGLKILEKMTLMVQDGELVETNDIEEILNFLRLFADKCHHGKEEEILFPAMEKAGIPNERGPIGQMLIEHSEGRKYIKEMGASIQDGSINESAFIQAASNYINLLRAHIKKENMVLFPMGDKVLPIDEQKEIMTKFQELDEKVIGIETIGKMLKLLDDFKDKYQVAQ